MLLWGALELALPCTSLKAIGSMFFVERAWLAFERAICLSQRGC